MAKKSFSIKFRNGTLSKDKNRFTITEITKDDSTEYDFSAILNELVGNDGLSLTITSEDNIEPSNDDEV